jgi:hypothetical protein
LWSLLRAEDLDAALLLQDLRAAAHQDRDLRGEATEPKGRAANHEQLQADLATMSYLAVGRKYGVSDNAVRKWLRWYEREVSSEAA